MIYQCMISTQCVSGTLADSIIAIKREFAQNYSGGAHIQEAIPASTSDMSSVDAKHLELLHVFAKSNPIYCNSFSQTICGTECIVYEGDINEYWLDSIKHGSSCQPFYPTWMFSAFVLALSAADLGCTEVVDIGSGDGRISFCASILGMRAYSIEIDDALVNLQRMISKKTGVPFDAICADALEMDYPAMNISKPAFFVGGLPQMGGELLADGLLHTIKKTSVDHNPLHSTTSDHNTSRVKNETDRTHLLDASIIVLAGQGALSGPAAKKSVGAMYGWDSIIDRHTLDVKKITTLPTVWTFDRDEETPYIFAKHIVYS